LATTCYNILQQCERIDMFIIARKHITPRRMLYRTRIVVESCSYRNCNRPISIKSASWASRRKLAPERVWLISVGRAQSAARRHPASSGSNSRLLPCVPHRGRLSSQRWWWLLRGECTQCRVLYRVKNVKLAHTRLPSVGFRS